MSPDSIRELLSNQQPLLIPTQKNICLPIIIRLVKKMNIGIMFTGIKTEGLKIIDGHHRYIAALISKTHLEYIQSLSSSSCIEYQWNDIYFEQNDWDTEEEILQFNVLDALYNNLTLDVLLLSLEK